MTDDELQAIRARADAATHVLTVHFEDGETEYLTLRCQLTGPERPCAVITCPVDHEDVSRVCLEAHGAVALDECWAESWYTNGGREALTTQDLASVEIPVTIEYDTGVVVHNTHAREDVPALLAHIDALTADLEEADEHVDAARTERDALTAENERLRAALVDDHWRPCLHGCGRMVLVECRQCRDLHAALHPQEQDP